jgi:prolyl-tRNA synthetase
VSGDHEISLAKLSKLGEIKEVEFERVKEIVGVGAGFISPVGSEIKVVADVGLRGRKGLVGGGNEENYHYVGIDMSRDIKVEQWLDLEVPNKGDECEVCGNELEFVRTIEVGSIFKLGSHYSTLMGAYFLDEKGRRKPIIMGSYGIGIERLIAAIVETHHDEEGIIWPEEVAPYKVVIILLNPKKEKSKKMKEEVIKKMEKHVSREEILIDERDISVGVKFKDNMLIGVPWQVIIGEKGEKEGKVEIKDRKGEVVKLVSPNKIVEEVC